MSDFNIENGAWSAEPLDGGMADLIAEQAALDQASDAFSRAADQANVAGVTPPATTEELPDNVIPLFPNREEQNL